MNRIKQTPWHLNPMAALAVVWGLIGAGDDAMRHLDVATYPGGPAAAWAAAAADLPGWIAAAWVVGVWAALIGAGLLALHERIAPAVLALAFLAMLVAVAGATATGAVAHDGAAVVILGALTAAGLVFWLYARRMRISGALG